jgi:acyl carrier protein
MPRLSESETLNDLARILRDFHGREYAGDLGPDTLFFADLGMSSIDAVVLGEIIERYYGQRLPFPQFLAELAQSGAQDLSLGELARFLAQHVQRPGRREGTCLC